MPLPVWTQDDEENWQRMMEEAARMKRREQLSAAQQQDRSRAPGETGRILPKDNADGRSLAASTQGVNDGQRRNGESLFSSAADGSAQSGDRMAAAGLGGAGARLFEYRPSSAFGGASREDAQRFRLNPSANPGSSSWPAERGDRDYVESIKRNGAVKGMRGLFGVNPQLLEQAFGTAGAVGSSGEAGRRVADRQWTPTDWVPYPLHGWTWVPERDEKKLKEMMRRNPKAADEYAKKVAEQIYRDHPVEMWLPYGPNLPGKQEQVKDVDALEHSGWWAHATVQERAGLADLLAQGKEKEANEYARKLNQAIQARLTKQELNPNARPAPPPVPPQAYDDARINNLRLWQVKNILDNEHAFLKPGTSSNDQWRTANMAVANAIMNGDIATGPATPKENPRSLMKYWSQHGGLDMAEQPGSNPHWLPKRPDTADSEASKLPPGNPQSEYDWEIVRQAYQNRMMGKPDPAAGRAYFGTSDEPIRGRAAALTNEQYRNLPRGAPLLWETTYTSQGPFTYPSKKHPVKQINLYNKPYQTKKGQQYLPQKEKKR